MISQTEGKIKAAETMIVISNALPVAFPRISERKRRNTGQVTYARIAAQATGTRNR